MCNYYISDLHFHHPKAIHMDERPFVDLGDFYNRIICNHTIGGNYGFIDAKIGPGI